MLLRIAGTFTLAPFEEQLRCGLEEFGLPYAFELMPYGQMFQQLLHPESGLYGVADGLTVLVVAPEDLPATDAALELADALTVYRSQSQHPVLVLVGADSDPQRGERITRDLLARTTAIADTSVITAETIQRRYPVAQTLDPLAAKAGHIPYTREYYAALTLSMIRHAWRLQQRERKVLALDCDNTLWGGVCGEHAPQDLELDAGHLALQRFAREQSQQGVVLCLNSKNAEADVWQVFERHPEMVLGADDVVAAEINWQPKSANLQQLATRLDLGLDSFVFIDDNPLEIAEVEAGCPAVLAMQLPADAAGRQRFAEHLWALDKHRVTESDALRVQSYRDNTERHELQASSPTFSEFLEALQLDVQIATLDADTLSDIPRIAQLFVRTTQFNATNRTHTETELHDWVEHANLRLLTCRVRDRFGDYGLVGAMAVDLGAQQITDFVLSCRVLGKGVEHAMVRAAGQLLQGQVALPFTTTPRNEPLRNFYQTLPGDMQDNVVVCPASALHDFEFTPQAHIQKVVTATSNGVSAADIARVHDVAQRLADPAQLVALLDGDLKGRPADLPLVLPKPGTETTLAEIWSKVLRITPVGREDQFTDLGGSSLDLVRVHRLVFQAFNKDMDMTELLSAPTVAALASIIDGESEGAALDLARTRAGRQRAQQTAQRQARRGVRRTRRGRSAS